MSLTCSPLYIKREMLKCQPNKFEQPQLFMSSRVTKGASGLCAVEIMNPLEHYNNLWSKRKCKDYTKSINKIVTEHYKLCSSLFDGTKKLIIKKFSYYGIGKPYNEMIKEERVIYNRHKKMIQKHKTTT